MKKLFKIGFFLLVIIFFGLYLSYKNGYYEKRNEEKKILTDTMIEEYENDLKNGVDVTKKEYVITKPNYTNIYTQTFLQVSKKIEDGVNSIIKFFFRKVGNYVNE